MNRLALWIALALLAGFGVAARAAVPISFLPPPLEDATYSLGVYEAKSGKLVRHLREIAAESEFTAGLNGLITQWDGKNDGGVPVPPGKYAARGYAVGALKVEGVEILGNDWVADDKALRITSVRGMLLVPADNGLVIVGFTPDDRVCVARYGGPEGKLLWQSSPSSVAAPLSVNTLFLHGDTLVVDTANGGFAYRLADGGEIARPPAGLATASQADDNSNGKDGSAWKIGEIVDKGTLIQLSAQGERLRTLIPKEGEPLPVAVAAAKDADRLYLLEEKQGWQRLRGLSWVETKEEDGKPVSTWQTFFERNIRTPEAVLGLEGTAIPVEIGLVANPLDPGKPQKINLAAAFDDEGSYLTTVDGLRLRQISQQPNLRVAKLEKGKGADVLTYFQFDAAAWDEFSIDGAKNMMAFDAGEFDLTATGEKPLTGKAPEPDSGL